MANENPSRENQSRQQSAERAQSGTAQQGAGAQRGTGSSSYGQGQGTSGQATGTSTWQGGRQQSGGALQQRRGSPSMAPYTGYAGYGSGPFSVMRRISDEMDRLFETFGMGRGLFPGESRQGELSEYGGYGEATPSMWSPHIEVCERSGKLLIQADLPGMKRDDVNVRVESDEVIIQGERRQEQTSDQRGYYRSERSYGSFYRAIPLPEGTNADSASASFRDGVLEIEFDAPRQQQRGRTLEIRDGGSSQAGTSTGTGSGTTYGAGTSGSMQGASSGGTGSSGSGTMYSGSGEPSAGAAGMGADSTSSGSRERGRKSS
jgi:HSP20 family protein